MLSTLGAGALAGAAAAPAGGRTGGSDAADFVSDFAVAGAIAFSAAYTFDVWYVKCTILNVSGISETKIPSGINHLHNKFKW